MEKYKFFFEEIKEFKSLSETKDDLVSLFENDNITDYKIKKIINHFIEQKIIEKITYKKRNYFISVNTINASNLTIDALFAEKVINTNLNLKKIKKINYNNHLSTNAIVVKKLSELI
jgi:uncharacterized protein YqfB (UPF0267 family)